MDRGGRDNRVTDLVLPCIQNVRHRQPVQVMNRGRGTNSTTVLQYNRGAELSAAGVLLGVTVQEGQAPCLFFSFSLAARGTRQQIASMTRCLVTMT